MRDHQLVGELAACDGYDDLLVTPFPDVPYDAVRLAGRFGVGYLDVCIRAGAPGHVPLMFVSLSWAVQMGSSAVGVGVTPDSIHVYAHDPELDSDDDIMEPLGWADLPVAHAHGLELVIDQVIACAVRAVDRA